MIYRREIDGLRTIAVVPVILFHAGLTVFSGGYVGVDVFFVISGYLITSILIAELEQDNFSIVRFYERRARRILPALFFVMLCCVPFAWMWMLPSELKDFSDSVLAVVFFASNILFWREQGYFAPAAELKPLLHTWSLAVEEQYYLLFPVFLMLAWRFGRNRVFWLVCVIAAVSLAASEWGWRNEPSANFYLAPTRAWELLIGSICAFWLSGREQRGNNWLSLAGLGLIVFAIFFFDDETPIPSVYALVPVLGTALIILFGGTGTWAARLLGMRGFVGIGLISYSAYLWHQPLFAFARIHDTAEPAQSLMLVLAAASLVLAYFSWRYVEKPFRNGQASILPTRRAVFTTSAVVAAVFVAGGLVGHSKEGFPQRSSRLDFEGDIGHPYFHDYTDAKFVDCRPKEIADEALTWEGFLRCKQSKPGNSNIALIGDSHAEHLFVGLAENLDENIVYYIKDSGPTADNKEFEKIFNYVIEYPDIKTVAISFYFVRFKEDVDVLKLQESFLSLVRKLQSRGKQIVLVKDVPTFATDAEACVFSQTRQIAYDRCRVEKAKFLRDAKKYNSFVDYFENEAKIFVYDPIDILCGQKYCDMIVVNQILYRDTNHLNLIGSRKVGNNFSQFIRNLRKS